MELLKDYSTTRVGNDCLIRDYVSLIRMSDDVYSVIHVNSVFGGWTGNPVKSSSEVFPNESSATNYMNEIISRL